MISMGIVFTSSATEGGDIVVAAKNRPAVAAISIPLMVFSIFIVLIRTICK